MTREFLQGLHIDNALIDQIMAEHGKTVQKYKDEAETKEQEAKTLKAQLKTANDKIAEFKDLEPDKIRQEAEEWKQKAKQAEEAAKNEIDSMKKATAVRLAVGDTAYDADLVAGLINMDLVQLTEGGKVTGVEEQIKALQKSKSFLFKTGETKTEYTPQTGKIAAKNPWAKDTFNLTEQGKIFKENPAMAKSLMAAAGIET